MTDYALERIYDNLAELAGGNDMIGSRINSLRDLRQYVDELIDDLIYLQLQDDLEDDWDTDHPADRFPSYRGD